MKNGKFANAPSPKHKSVIIVLSIILLVCIGVGATLAYFANSTGPVINTFQSGTVGAEIYEKKTDTAKTVIQVKNTGSVPVYVRVRLVSYFEDDFDNVLPQDSPAVSVTPGENWEQIGSYYYYKLPVAAEDSTSNLLKEGTYLSMVNNQVIEVLADTVQATPKDAIKNVWGDAAAGYVQ